ncbi:MAG TPA: response regulator transcription factor [Gaiellaceae bacterium]|nr:response regulator transcription factor [Gaiellaceae bacterium]
MSAALVIAEPEEAARGVLERHLAAEGFRDLAGDDPHGLVERSRPDLVVLGDPAALGPELVERIRAVLRPPADGPDVVAAGPVRLDPRTRRASLHGRPLVLAQKEYELLLTLAREPDRLFAREELLQSVWDYPSWIRTRTLDSHVSRLRRKFREIDPETTLVANVWGQGYRLFA